MNYNSFCFTGHGTVKSTGKFDPGSCAQGVREYDLAKKITDEAKRILSTNAATKGLSVHYGEQNYENDLLAGNSYSAKCGISVHINAGGGTGTEIYVPCKEIYLEQDFEISNNISKLLSIPNRGVKSRDYDSEITVKRTNKVKSPYSKDYYREIRKAWEKGISLAILEVGFIDTSDLNKMEANINGIAQEVAKYIASCCGVKLSTQTSTAAPTQAPTSTTQNTTANTGKYYRVCIGSFKDKKNAEKLLADAKKKGYSAFIHEC